MARNCRASVLTFGTEGERNQSRQQFLRSCYERRIEKILNYAIKLQDYVVENNVTKERLMTEENLRWLVTTPLCHICKQIYDLSKNFTEKHSNIEWEKFSSLYYELAHNYDEINWNDISEIIVDLPIFVKQIEESKGR